MAGKEVRAGKAFVEITLRDQLQAGLNRAAARLKSFAAVTSGIGAGLTGASAAILGPLAAAVKQFSDTGDAVEKMAARTGMSAEAVSELGHAADLSGTDMGTLENGIRRMQQTIGDAANGVGSAQEALAGLGLSVAGLQGLSPDQQFAKIADRIAAIQDPALRTAAAMDIFGRSGTQLLPMMADGAAGLQVMRDQAKALGLTISTDTAASAAALNDALGTMWSSIKALTLNLGAALAPIVTEAANRISAVVASITKFIQKNHKLVVTVAGVAAAIGLAGGALLAIGGAAAVASFALSGLASLVGIVGTVIGGIGAVVGAILSPVGLLITGIVAAAGAWLYFSGVGGTALRWLQTRFGELVAFVQKVAGGIGDALMAGDLELAARILWAAIKVAYFRGIEEVSALWGRLKEAAQQAWAGIRSASGQAINWLVTQWSTVQTAASRVWQSVAAGFQAATTTIRQTASTVFQSVVSTIGSAIQTASQFIQGLPERFVAAVQYIRSLVASAFTGLSGSMISSLTASASQAGSAILEALSRPLEMLRGVWQRVTETARSAWSGLVSLASSVASAVGTAFSTMTGAVQTVFGNLWQSLSAGASQVTAFFGRTLSAVGQAGAAIATGFMATITQVKDATVETFSAIGTALAHGEFALAGEIAWASIKLAFAQGIAWMSSTWTEFTTGLAMIWDNVVTSIRQVWNNVVSWIAKAILRLVGIVRSTLDVLEEIDPSGLAGKLKEKLSFDVEGAVGIVEEDRQQFNRGLDTARQQRDDQRVAEMQRRLAETEKRLEELRAARQQVLAKVKDLEAVDEKDSPLAKAMTELEAAIAEAAKAPKLFDSESMSSQLQASEEALSTQVETARRIAAQGTFNPFSIRGLGADSLAERHFKATERVADNTARLLKEAKQGGVKFA